MVNVAIDQRSVDAFSDAVNKIVATSKKDLRTVIDQQAKLLAIQAMHHTPPWDGGKIPGYEDGNAGSTLADKRAGMEAAKKSILKTVIAKSQLFEKEEFQDKWLEKIVRRKDKQRLQAYFDNVKSNTLKKYKVVDFAEDLHTNKRTYGRRFRPRNQYKFTFDEGKLNTYIRKVQKTVGWMKAGWGVAVQRFGGKMPGWVSSNLGYARGSAGILNEGETTYTVEMSNWTPSIGRFASAYSVAMNVRTNALTRMYNDYLQKTLKKSFK